MSEPERLDPATLATALEAVPGWHVEQVALVRVVDVAAGPQALTTSVRQVADEMGQRPDIQTDGGRVTFASAPPRPAGSPKRTSS